MLENITLNESNVTASIDAYIHHCLFGYNGVFKCGQQLKCEIINNNLLKIYDGLFINQGRFYRIAPGSYEEIKLENGVVGQKRYDLIVSHFETDGVNEKHEIKVISGEGETVPQYTDSDTFNGGTVVEDACSLTFENKTFLKKSFMCKTSSYVIMLQILQSTLHLIQYQS